MQAQPVTKTGTPGLDELFSTGGFGFKSSVLVSGEPGVGKTLVALQFIYNGARLYGESGVYVTSEQSIERARELAKNMGMDLAKFEENGMLKLMKIPITHGYEMAPAELMKEVKKAEVKRVAIDSITPLEYLCPDIKSFRARILSLIEMLTSNDVTLMVVAERRKTSFQSMEFAPEDFLFDCLIVMGRIHRGIGFEKALSVIKSRGTRHSEEMHLVEITDSGLIIKGRE